MSVNDPAMTPESSRPLSRSREQPQPRRAEPTACAATSERHAQELASQNGRSCHGLREQGSAAPGSG
jgi:hypothetical protein